MVVFMNALVALATVPHPDPLVQLADQAQSLLLESTMDLGVAVISIAGGVVLDDEEVQDGGSHHEQVGVGVAVDVEGNEQRVADYRILPYLHFIYYRLQDCKLKQGVDIFAEEGVKKDCPGVGGWVRLVQGYLRV
jgi:hypothetical protein